jgi:hypothetical protein
MVVTMAVKGTPPPWLAVIEGNFSSPAHGGKARWSVGMPSKEEADLMARLFQVTSRSYHAQAGSKRSASMTCVQAVAKSRTK